MVAPSNPKVKSSQREAGTLTKFYLFLYNAGQVCGWSYLLYQLGTHFLNGGKTDTLWNTVKYSVILFQNAALLEIVNAALGFVKSNVMITVMQVLSRVAVVLGLWVLAPPARESFGLPLALLAWSVTEIIRYSMYALSMIGGVPYILTWCRYTFFYFLYPIGVTGELLCYYATQEYARRSKLLSYELPNTWNFAFNYQYVLVAVMLSYIPLFPQMYHHMILQRKKVIGKNADMDKKKK